jgi:hypothetical protein
MASIKRQQSIDHKLHGIHLGKQVTIASALQQVKSKACDKVNLIDAD